MRNKKTLFWLALISLSIWLLPVGSAATQGEVPGRAPSGASASAALLAPDAIPFFYEAEPNNTPATANALPGAQVVAYGNIWTVGDLDYFAFSGNAGDRVYAATMTSFAAGATDTTLTLFDTDGATVIEVDVNDGSFAAPSSSIAGATLPANGVYYLQVRATSATASMRPYHLYLKVWSGAPSPETEPNNLADGGQPIPGLGWVSGVIDPAADNDVFTFNLLAGDTVFLSLDLDPARVGGTTWNGRLGLGAFGAPPLILVVNDANTTSPNSEAFFFTVKESGPYYAYVDHPTGAGAPTQTYHMSAVRFPAVPATASCTTYTSTDVPVTIPDGPGVVQSTLTVPGSPRIADIDVTLVLTHTNMPDLDVVLTAPSGNQVVLFNDIGVSTQPGMNMTLDDEAAIPVGSYTVVSGMIYQPPATRRLDWFDDQNAGGVWTLQVYDDLAANGGVLQGWNITVCEPPPPPTCPTGYQEVTVFSSNFEADNGGFTSSGAENEWQWGAPAFAPITSCNSGANCWVTDLTGTYNASSNQNLLSPPINLSGLSGPVIMRWAQKHQIESASFDPAFVQVQQVGGAGPTRIWEWLGPTMSNLTVGSPTVTVPQSAGWGEHWADISSYAGQSIEALFNLTSDSSVQFAGLAIDDVAITACEPVAANPAISLAKTVGTDPAVCAVTDAITVPAGTAVTYCYEVTNTGDVTLNLHDLDDSELGNLFTGLSYALAPGASAFVTETTTINVTTVNTATWTAYNAGPADVAVATDTATVTVASAGPAISLNKTVGTVPGVCAVTDDVTVTAGTEVYYCYQVENTGDVTFSFHDLVDSELGTILNDLPYVLAPGAFSPQVIVPATPMSTVTNVGTWTAVTALGDYVADDAIPFNWQDISATGTAVTLTDDSVSGALPIGFPFEFYGVAYNNIYASSNGFLTVLSGSPNGCCTGGILPNTATPNGVIAGWWEDLNPSVGGTVHYQTLGTAPNRVFIVQYTDIPHYPSGNLVTKQYKLFETTNAIEVHYQAAPSDGGTHSAGIENQTGTLGIQYYRGTAALPTPLAVRYYLTTVESAFDTDTATVTVLTPNIDVDPLSYTVVHGAPQVTTAPITIANTGQGDLVWNIAEEPTRLQPEPLRGGDAAAAAERVGPSDLKSPAPAAPAAPSAWRAPQAVLYDNGPLVTNPGAGAGGADVSALQTAIGLGTFGFGQQLSAGNRVADDFTVTGGGWFIDTFTFFTYQTGSSTTSTINHVNLRIWNGAPGDPGSSVVFGDTTTNRLVSTTWTNIYRTLDTSLGATDRPIMNVVAAVNTFLPAGTYWVDWQVGGTLTSGPWAPPISIVGQTNTGNAQQWTGAWAPALDGTFPQGFPFIIEGMADCSSLVDLPWLSVSPANGVNGGGTSTVGTVTFDSTGLVNGTYTANLCVFSNDPDVGPGNGTQLVIVPVELTVQGAAGISVVKTVGTTPGVCAPTSAITVLEGTTVYYCYEVTNTGSVTLNLHDLVDDQVGTIFSGLNYALTPGSSIDTVAAGLTISAVINATTTNTATWTAYNAGGPSATAMASATVTALPRFPNIDVAPLALASTQPPDYTANETLTIGNTGDSDLTWMIAEEPAVVRSTAGGAAPAASLPDATISRGGSGGGPAPLAYTSPADFSEGFNDITVLPGWFFQNNSAPVGTTSWFQGNDTVFPAHAGAPTAYIGANFNNTAGTGTISNWMLTPVLNLNNGDTISFWTRVPAGSIWPDRLELRLSTAGASTNVGALATDVGDFTTLLLSVNPTLTAGGYPEVWTQYTATLSGVPAGATGRIAFRYFVTNGGPSGSNSNYIGIDTVEYVSAAPTVCANPADVPWLSVSPAMGTTAAGGSTPVTVTFDSTGLAVGVYDANLCITSNDPDAGPGNGTELVIVPVRLNVFDPTAVDLSALSTRSGVTGAVWAAALTAVIGLALTTVYLRRKR